MLPVTVHRVLLAQHRVDFRKGFDGLLAEAYRIGARPYDGDCVVFVKRDRTQLRALVGDGFGLYLVSRRFEGGRLRLLLEFAERPGAKIISTGELSLLLEGASFTVHKRAQGWRARRPDAERSTLATS
jgi:transposase